MKDAQAVALRKGGIPESIHEDLPKVNLSGMVAVGIARALTYALFRHPLCNHRHAPAYVYTPGCQLYDADAH